MGIQIDGMPLATQAFLADLLHIKQGTDDKSISVDDFLYSTNLTSKDLSRVGFCVDTGILNAYVATPVVGDFQGYENGITILFQPATTNTVNPSIDLDGLGTKGITLSDGSAIPTGYIVAGGLYTLTYQTGTDKWVVDNASTSFLGKVYLASNAEVLAGTNTTKVVTPASLENKLNTEFGNVDNTSDLNKPISTATQTALDGKLSSAVLTLDGDVTGSLDLSTAGVSNLTTSVANIPASTPTHSLSMANNEATDFTSNGTLGFDTSQGLLINRSSVIGDGQGGSGTYTVLDKSNVSAGANIALSGNTVNTTNSDPFVIAFDSTGISPTVTLTGDVTGTGTHTDLGNTSFATTVVSASTTVAGKVELATNAEAIAGTDTARAVTPAALQAALDSFGGGGTIDADTLDGFDSTYFLPAASYTASDVLAKLLTVDGTTSGLDADLLDGQQGSFYQNASNINTGTLASARMASATASAKGAVELATNAETATGTDATRAVTPAGLASVLASYSTLPVGATMSFALSVPPTGWLLADGSAVSRTTYSALFAAVGTTWGVGDGSTTFNLPYRFVMTMNDGTSPQAFIECVKY